MLLEPARHHRPKFRHSRKRAASPTLEGLEDRLLLYAASGGHWAYGTRITYSFMPDGTSIGGLPSAMFQTLNPKFGQVAWQQQVEKAAAAWEAVANINLALVPDDGSPVAINGYQQGDPRFGDIRIGGFAQSPYQLAFTFSPPPFNGGTLSGDIFFNTAQSWQINGNTFDLETVAIHEIGHALGMSHSAISSAVMYAYYTGYKQTLTSDDIAGIQTVYGAPLPDVFDAMSSNNFYTTATVLNPLIGANGQLAIGGLDITGSIDPDWYLVTAPANTTGTMTVSVQATGLSSLSPAVYVYNSVPQALGRAVAGNTYGGTATFTLPGVTAGQSYYIKVVGADLGASGQGGYGLLVNFGSSPQNPVPPPWTIVLQQPDQGGGGSSDVVPSGAIGPWGNGVGHAWGHVSQMDNGGSDNNGSDHKDDGNHDNGDDHQFISVGDLFGWGDDLTVSNLAAASVPGPAESMPAAHVQAGKPLGTGATDPLYVPLVLGSTGLPGPFVSVVQANRHFADHATDLVSALDRALEDWQ